MKISRTITSGIAAAALVGAIGLAFAQTSDQATLPEPVTSSPDANAVRVTPGQTSSATDGSLTPSPADATSPAQNAPSSYDSTAPAQPVPAAEPVQSTTPEMTPSPTPDSSIEQFQERAPQADRN